MKLYLSSYRLGNHTNEFKKLVGKENAKVAVSVNALDFSDDLPRKTARLAQELSDIESLGYIAEELDLRKYFGKSTLLDDMKNYDAVWFSGGNTFILAKSFKLSGFDKVIQELVKTDQLVYSGYSAAFCVLYSSLHGIELVDNKDASAIGYPSGEVWNGIGLVDFYPIVHFRSDHPESSDVEMEYEYVKEHGIPFKTFKDGDAYLVCGDDARSLT